MKAAETVVKLECIGAVPGAAVGDGDGGKVETPLAREALGGIRERGLGGCGQGLREARGERGDGVVAQVPAAVTQANGLAVGDGCDLDEEHVFEGEGGVDGSGGLTGSKLGAAGGGSGRR